MKKILLLGAFATALNGCNNHSHHDETGTDTATHNDHQKTSGEMNPVTQTMNDMMHQMHRVSPTGNNEADFATMMIEHHKGAVAMSNVELEKGTDSTLRQFARQVVTDQSKEISFMENILLKTSKEKSATSVQFHEAVQTSMTTMMAGDTPVYNNVDKDFAAHMIPHHQSAVDMARAYLEFGKNKELTKLCENIISSQAKEIAWLKEWLQKNP